MHTKRTVVAIVTLCALFVSLWMLPDAAASEGAREPARPLAEMTLGASRVDWLPMVDSESLVLTVAGPGDLYIQREFGAGETPFFSSLDVQGGRIPDGIYAYELRAAPRLDPELREKLAKAREMGDDSVMNKLRQGGKLPEGPQVQSGHLWVEGGSFVNKVPAQPGPNRQSKSKSKTPANITANTTVPDDLIVEGHACIGSECVDATGPALKIKEGGNYTIQFDALSCCVPWERRWALQANEPGVTGDFLIRDVTQGTIPFRVGSAAPDNALTIFPNGNIGLGTLTPAVRLDVKTSAAGQATERLQNSSATGYSGIEYLDNAGNVDLFFGVDNAASTTRLNSANNNPIVILTNGTEQMRVTPAGNVGIGTSSPGSKLHIFDNAADVFTVLTVQNTGSGVNSLGTLRAQSNAAIMSIQAHGSGRTLSRFGQSLASWVELIQSNGNGLIIGTQFEKPLILGTNNTNRLQIDGSTGAVTVSGDLTVTGTKNFAVADPADARRAIYYTALEGPEAGTYVRGTAKTAKGEAVIELPDYFARLTEPERLTVQLTPLGTWGQLYVAEKTPSRLVVRMPPGSSDLEFDYFVQGVRKGYLNYQVERPNTLPE